MQSEKSNPSANQVLFDMFANAYQNFMTLLTKMPIDPTLKYRLIHDAGTVFLWTKEAMIEVERVANEPKLEVVENTNEIVKDQACAS